MHQNWLGYNLHHLLHYSFKLLHFQLPPVRSSVMYPQEYHVLSFLTNFATQCLFLYTHFPTQASVPHKNLLLTVMSSLISMLMSTSGHSLVYHVNSQISQDRPLGTFATPFNQVNIDIVGPLPPSYVFSYILTCIDYSTQWPEAIAITAKTAAQVCIYTYLDILFWCFFHS